MARPKNRIICDTKDYREALKESKERPDVFTPYVYASKLVKANPNYTLIHASVSAYDCFIVLEWRDAN